jgi:hypothetical protein
LEHVARNNRVPLFFCNYSPLLSATRLTGVNDAEQPRK